MTTQTQSYLEAIAHLPAGGTLILTDVPWEEYELLLADLGDCYGVNIYYDQGRLEIMSPSSNHEMYSDLILHMGRIIADETNSEFESRGSTTFKQKELRKAAEPDTCFYVQNASRIIGVANIDLSVDPPPDIVVEVDVSHETTGKLGFYATLGVPELWRYDEKRAHIYHLRDGHYVEMPASRAFLLLTSEALTQFLEQSKSEGQSAALRSFRDWLRRQQAEKEKH
jgi:Uma2 family endonuclease